MVIGREYYSAFHRGSVPLEVRDGSMNTATVAAADPTAALTPGSARRWFFHPALRLPALDPGAVRRSLVDGPDPRIFIGRWPD